MNASFDEYQDLNIHLSDLMSEGDPANDPYRQGAPAAAPPTTTDDVAGDKSMEESFPAVAGAHLGLAELEFVELFGIGWEPLDTSDWDSQQQANLFDSGGCWYVSGEPAQLMARLVEGGLELASPKGVWSGSHELVLRPANLIMLELIDVKERIQEVVTSLLKRRRSTFRYCIYCRGLTPPEARFSPDCCYGCARTVHSVVY